MRAPLQFVLDFFTGGDPVVPAAPTMAPAVAPLVQPSEPPPASTPTGAPPLRVLPTPETTGFTHPNANRHAVLHGMTVSFLFERSRRRSIGFLVGAEGLVVRAPSWVTLREVDAAVQEKGAWSVAKLQQFNSARPSSFSKPSSGRMVRMSPFWAEIGRAHV